MQSTPAVTRNEMRPVKYHYADSFWCTYIISVISANIAEMGKLRTRRRCMKTSRILILIHLFFFYCSYLSIRLDQNTSSNSRWSVNIQIRFVEY